MLWVNNRLDNSLGKDVPKRVGKSCNLVFILGKVNGTRKILAIARHFFILCIIIIYFVIEI